MNDRPIEKQEAEEIMRDFLHVLKNQFYADDEKRFWKHRYILIQAIAWPASTLKQMGVWLPAKRLREILTEIVDTVKHHGATGQVAHFGGYFLHCVQAHMHHRRERFYEEGKTARAAAVAKLPLDAILSGVTVSDGEETTDRLANMARFIRGGRKAGKKGPKAADQLTLL